MQWNYKKILLDTWLFLVPVGALLALVPTWGRLLSVLCFVAVILRLVEYGFRRMGDSEFSIFLYLFYMLTGQLHREKEDRAIRPNVPAPLRSREPQGVIIGQRRGEYVCRPDGIPQAGGHFAIMGGTNSGKTSCIAIPTLYSYEGRVFAIDIKNGELYDKAGKYRPHAVVFNPRDRAAKGYDPFWTLEGSRNKPGDIKQIAYALLPADPNEKNPYFSDSARNIFAGALLYYHELGYSFVQAVEAITDTATPQLVKLIYENGSTYAKRYVSQFVGLKAEELGSIASTLSNKINVFALDSEIMDAFSRPRNITPHDLERGEDIFIQVPESKLDEWKPILTMIVYQFIRYFDDRAGEQSVPILFMLDEFARLGKLDGITGALATLRSKGVTVMLLTQSIADFDRLYGESTRRVIMDNCPYQLIFRATDSQTQKMFSNLVGSYDSTKKSYSTDGKSETRTTEVRPIIRPEEFATLRDIVVLSPYGYFRVDRASCYSDPNFSRWREEQAAV